MTSLVLHDYFRSSASYRVRIAMNLKGLTYDRAEVSLIAGEQRSDAYLEQNAQGFVPMLVADGEPIIQSLAIIDWLDSHDIYTTVRTSWATRLTQPTEYGIADALGQDWTVPALVEGGAYSAGS